MNKLVLLNEIRKEKIENNYRLKDDSLKNNINKSSDEEYVNFKNRFCRDKEISTNDLDNNVDQEKVYIKSKINKIINRIFSLDNKIPFINFINSIYDDCLGTNSKIYYVKNEEISALNNSGILKKPSCNIKINVEDEYRNFEYNIQLQIDDDENVALTILKKELSVKLNNVVNFNKKKKQYTKLSKETKDSLKNNSNLYLIMINSNIKVPDVYEINAECSGEEICYKLDIFKGWKYDFKQLFEKNMYLLFPIKVFDLKKRLYAISDSMNSKFLIKDEIVRFFREMNKYLKKAKDQNLMREEDIDEFNLIARELLNDFMKEKSIFI